MSQNQAMRTKQQLAEGLAEVNVQALSRLSGVNAKTIYRIRGNAEYNPGTHTAELLSNALDTMLKATKRRRTAKAEA